MAGWQTSTVEKKTRPIPYVPIPEIGFCAEKARLQCEFLLAIRQWNAILAEQTQAVIDEDCETGRFDVLLHLAQERKETAKYAWITHVESHGCDR